MSDAAPAADPVLTGSIKRIDLDIVYLIIL